MREKIILFTLGVICVIALSDSVKILTIKEVNDDTWTELGLFNGSLFNEVSVTVNRDNSNTTHFEVCQNLEEGVWAVLDNTWSFLEDIRGLSKNTGVVFLKLEPALVSYLRAVDKTLTILRNATSAAYIFQTEQHLQQSLYYLVRDSYLRVILYSNFSDDDAESLSKLRPTPEFIVVFGDTPTILDVYKKANSSRLALLAKLAEGDQQVVMSGDRGDLAAKLYAYLYLIYSKFIGRLFFWPCIRQSRSIGGFWVVPSACFRPSLGAINNDVIVLNERWVFVFFDEGYKTLDPFDLKATVTLFVSRTAPFNAFKERYLGEFKTKLEETVSSLARKDEALVTSIKVSCDDFVPQLQRNVSSFYQEMLERFDTLAFDETENRITPQLVQEVRSFSPTGATSFLGLWNSSSGLTKADNVTKLKRFFRVGTGTTKPFASPVIDGTTGKVSLNKDGSEKWEGYCLDLIERLSQDMDFDYTLIKTDDFGKKYPDGSWSGLVGALVNGSLDIVVASLTMTSEREEVIDFVAPYFEQSGFSIVIRKPQRTTSLFKFMTVLRIEVWFSILGALCLTAIMIWFLDKYSPYSAKNNKKLYPYPCRNFTIKESFWFAVTSFTPQGGGEAPKSMSARILVAAYWLFVVLMLATFTANLAAFLTVERMQSPVQSLKQLARQSRINYTVVHNSDAHDYFRNMKNAEETLYRMWKEITLNSTVDQARYRVWDYPIKEQYGQILIAIERTGTVPDAMTGFEKVEQSENAEFALIHDALEIKYEVYGNCNLTEIGEPFAEQPYAIAVQQGSYLNEELSRRVLDLQRDRFFEHLSSKFWNASNKAKCDSYDEDEGITLESLGGVFIATLFGLVIAMLTLGFEVLYQKKKKNKIRTNKNDQRAVPSFFRDEIVSKDLGANNRQKTNPLVKAAKPRVKLISVYPRDQLY